jgi:AraC family transcriptional regulator, regulatory protein of adaptative response / methylated-DNA-[protein]-cysteine methyltransferase
MVTVTKSSHGSGFEKRSATPRGGDSRWAAVLGRDRHADGAFVYAVRSTGVYCRPSCPSRKPARNQVAFFALPEAAEQQGYRACMRCRPRSIHALDGRIAAVAAVCREIDARIRAGASGALGDADVKLGSLSSAAGLSTHQLQRAFRRLMGITPRQYADAQRMKLLKLGLKKGDDVTTALYDAGFGSSSRLYERAPTHLGMTPATYRRGGGGMQIHYTIANSPLGRLLVGATDRGISALYLGEADANLEKALRSEYPRAEIQRDRSGMQGWVEKILLHLAGRLPDLQLPTDVQATAFQRRVWEELRRIPYGVTKTYSQVARAIGRPSAVRAVARACATNPTSIIVPCHRVVREDGSLSGYRWGIERKQALLEKEKSLRRPPAREKRKTA